MSDERCEHGEYADMPCEDCDAELGHDSWAPIDLGPYLRGEVVRPTPEVGLARSDALRLLYRGKEHSVIGEMEAGKSWFALACVAAELDVGHPVVYVHFEESDPSDTVERLLGLRVLGEDIGKLFRFVAPERAVGGEALARLLDPVPTLVVFDGVNEAMSLHRWGIREEDGAAMFRRHLVMPCTRVGAATLSCDHVVKDVERRGRNAIGSIHKGNGLSGALISLENAEPFGRGARGRSHVYINKDRPGHLRKHGKASTKTPGKTFMGELVVDATGLWPELKFYAPREDGAAEHETPDEDGLVLGAVVAVGATGAEPSLRKLYAAAGIRKQRVDEAVERLVLAGRLEERTGARNARVFTVPQDPSLEVAP